MYIMDIDYYEYEMQSVIELETILHDYLYDESDIYKEVRELLNNTKKYYLKKIKEIDKK